MADPTLSALVAVQQQCLRKKIRLDSYFRDFDRLNHKRVSVNRFERAILTARLEVSQSQVQELIQQYMRRDGMVDYYNFCLDCNKVFSVRGLEQNPTQEVTLSLAGANLRPIGQRLSDAEVAAARDIIQLLQSAVRNRGIILKTFFVDFDPTHSGFVSASRFARGLQTAGLGNFVTADQVKIVAKMYSDSNGDVSYKDFDRDISDQDPGASSGKATTTTTSLGANASRGSANNANQWEANGIMKLLIRLISERKIRLKMFFDEFDRMRTGYVKPSQFSTAMCMALGSLLTPAQIQVISDKYLDAAGEKVDYRSLCSYVDQAFTQRGLERSPMKGLDSVPWQIAHRDRIQLNELNESDMTRLAEVLRELRNSVSQSRSSLRSCFRDFDRTHKGVVTEDQFQRVLLLRKLMPANPMDVEVLLARYRSKGLTGTDNLFQYMPFIRDVQPNEAHGMGPAGGNGESSKVEEEEAKSSSGEPVNLQLMATKWRTDGVSASEVMHTVRAHCKQRRLRVKEFFKDSDPHCKGVIEVMKFRRGMKVLMHGNDITSKQLELIEERYCVSGDLQNERTWASGQPKIDWRAFARDVESVNTVANLEQNPTADVLQMTNTLLSEGLQSESSLSPSEEDTLNGYLSELRDFVIRINCQVRPIFAKFAKNGKGLISWSQFRRCLVLLVNGTQFNHIMPLVARSRFAVRRIGEGIDSYRVDYRAFCDAITPQSTSASKSASEDATSWAHDRAATPGIADINTLMTRIRRSVKGRGIHLKSFFIDYDKLNTGLCTGPRFIRAMNTALSTNFPMTFKEKQSICDNFRRVGADPDMVDYQRFCNEIDQHVHLETSPTKGVPTWQPWSFNESVNDVPREDLERILSQIRQQVSQRRIDVKPAFKMNDKTNRGTVTETQFLSRLAYLQLFPEIESDRNILIKAFRVQEPGQANRIHYVRFCTLVDPGL
eukprot:g4163.t1